MYSGRYTAVILTSIEQAGKISDNRTARQDRQRAIMQKGVLFDGAEIGKGI